jgi:hypothetical protein
MMSGLLIAVGITIAGACIGEAINGLGKNIKAGLEALAHVLGETEE